MTDPSNIIVEWDALHHTDDVTDAGKVVHVADAAYLVAHEPDVRLGDERIPSSGDWAVRRSTAMDDAGAPFEITEYYALNVLSR